MMKSTPLWTTSEIQIKLQVFEITTNEQKLWLVGDFLLGFGEIIIKIKKDITRYKI